jgi:serine/threonine protein kinase
MMERYCPYCMEPLAAERPCSHCGKDPKEYTPSVHHLPPDTLLQGRYRIGRVLGEGGFGITYLGLDENLGRLVAVKEYFPTSFVLRENSVSLGVTCYTSQGQDFYEKGRDQFLQEARTMARLDKEREIVRVMDFFSANNTAYLVMEFLEGETLKELVARRGPIPAEELLDLMRPVMAAVGTMHRAGILHRDVSPDNVMVLKDGGVKLMDFGCARELERGRTMTVVLKHGFAPLEQYTGRGQGPWSDVYSLSATLYYCLTGKVPPRAVERSGEADELIAPTQQGAALTPRQEHALLKGLAVRTRDRWQSAEEFYGALYGVEPDGSTGEEPTAEEIEAGRTEYVAQKDELESKDNLEQQKKEPTARGKIMSKYTKAGIGAAACLAAVGVSLAVLGGMPASPSLPDTGGGQTVFGGDESEVQTVGAEVRAEDAGEVGNLPVLPENETEQEPEETGGQAEQNPEIEKVRPGQSGTASPAGTGEQTAGQTSSPPAQTQPPELTAEELFNVGVDAYIADDYDTAVMRLRQADDKGHPDAADWISMAGSKYWEERGDLESALSVLNDAHRRGSTRASGDMCAIAYDFYSEENFQQALQIYQTAADLGDGGAMYSLYMLYLYGNGVAQSDAAAFSWAMKSAQAGNSNGYMAVGTCYLNGRGVEQNRDEARKWFQKGADAGNTSCEYYLKQMDQGSI